jgi:hypothetical protein
MAPSGSCSTSATEPQRTGRGRAIDVAFALGIGDAELPAQREAVAERAQLAEFQLRGVALPETDHRRQFDGLGACQPIGLRGVADLAGDGRVAAHHCIAAEQSIGFDRQRAAGAIGDETDRSHRDHRQHQRGDEDADVAGGEVASQLAPGEREQLHADTSRPPSSRSARSQRTAR